MKPALTLKIPTNEREGEIAITEALRIYATALREAPNGFRAIAAARWEMRFEAYLNRLKRGRGGPRKGERELIAQIEQKEAA